MKIRHVLICLLKSLNNRINGKATFLSLPRSESGMTLISVLVAASVGMIVMGTMMAMQMQQIKQNLILEKKLEIMAVETSLTKVLADSNTCKCMFVSGQNNPISLVDGFTGGVKSVSIKNGCSNTTWLAANAIIPGSSTNLKIEDAKLKNVSSIGTNVYQADLEISFQDTGLKMKPIISHQVFKTTGDNITDCVSGAADMASICTGFNGTYNANTGKCDTISDTCSQIGGTYDATNATQKCRVVASTNGGGGAACPAQAIRPSCTEVINDLNMNSNTSRTLYGYENFTSPQGDSGQSYARNFSTPAGFSCVAHETCLNGTYVNLQCDCSMNIWSSGI